MFKCMTLFFTGLTVLAVSACGTKLREAQGITPEQVINLRNYKWDLDVAAAEATWHPEKYLILARSAGGVILLREGRGGRRVFTNNDGTEARELQWLDDRHFIFGPDPVLKQAPTGEVLLPNYGLRIGEVDGMELGRTTVLTTSGYRPRIWNDQIVMSEGESLYAVTQSGRKNLIDIGFFPEPQRYGPGIAYQVSPVLHQDYWTSHTGVGELVVQWNKEQIDVFAGGVQPSWTRNGGLVYTALLQAPKDYQITSVPRNLMYAAGPEQKPILLAVGGHSAAAHPVEALVAFVDSQQRIAVASYDGLGSPKIIAANGRNPKWSPDGFRLLVEEDHPELVNTSVVRVYVLQLGETQAD